MRFTGKVVVVTGGGGGIGSAVCKRFAHEGARVAVLDLDEGAADETARTICSAGGQSSALVVDITQNDAVMAAVDETERQLGPIDVPGPVDD